ncbi:MAG: NrfD/PsrC family molybdoenzyme membrane anchor subunit, partial [Actinomycetes bacterium]
GVLLVAAAAPLAGAELGVLGRVVAPAVATGMTAATGVLLVWDLKRPERFLYIFLKPNPTSWLFWGSVALASFAAVAGGWLVVGAAGAAGFVGPGLVAGTLSVLQPLAVPTGVLAAGYTAFLFGQAEGRDLWQSPTLFWHLLAQASMAGSGALLTAAGVLGADQRAGRFLARTFIGSCAANLALLALEYGGRHPTRHAAAAAHLVTHGRYRKLFRRGAVGLTAAAAALAAPAIGGNRLKAAAVAGLVGQAALLAYESVFVRAGQDVPLS